MCVDMCNQSPAAVLSPGLLNLPLEIRHQIYMHLFKSAVLLVQDRQHDFSQTPAFEFFPSCLADKPPCPTAILTTCGQLLEEARQYLYREAEIVFLSRRLMLKSLDNGHLYGLQLSQCRQLALCCDFAIDRQPSARSVVSELLGGFPACMRLVLWPYDRKSFVRFDCQEWNAGLMSETETRERVFEILAKSWLGMPWMKTLLQYDHLRSPSAMGRVNVLCRTAIIAASSDIEKMDIGVSLSRNSLWRDLSLVECTLTGAG